MEPAVAATWGWPHLIGLIVGYLAGSIPFGLILTRMGGAGDIRSIGSGNIGATNVLRTGRKGLALATLLFDAAKGAIPVALAAYLFGRDMALVVGLGAVLGHCFPVWLKFKGGKGVATFNGLLLAAAWPLGLMAGAVWLICALLFRYSSLSALISSASAPLLALLPLTAVGLPVSTPILALTIFAAVLIWVRHQENIARLLKGQEPRIGAKKA